MSCDDDGEIILPMPTTELVTDIDLRDAVFDLDTDADASYVLNILTRVEFAMEQAKALKATLEARLLPWLQANGPLTLGTIRYYAGTTKVTKCRDVAKALEALMDAAHGDWALICSCLSSNALKHGAAHKVLTPEEWDQHWQIEEVPDLKEGKPITKVQRVDTKFLPGRAAGNSDTTQQE